MTIEGNASEASTPEHRLNSDEPNNKNNRSNIDTDKSKLSPEQIIKNNSNNKPDRNSDGGKTQPPPKEDNKSVDPHVATPGPADGDGYVAPPDGGWGWMVVFSSFLIHVIADGIVYSFGVFLTELVDYFKAGRGEITWVGSLQPAITFTVGPLTSALTNRYGCRVVTIAGALVATAGFVLSVWAPNHYYLYFTSGVMAGVGFGLIYLPAIVCVAQYFEKKRSFATGLAVCGSGFGTFVLAPVCKIFISEYGWRGAMLLLGGFTLNIVVCGIIFRPLTPDDSKRNKDESSGEEGVKLLSGDKAGEFCMEVAEDGKPLTAKEGLELISSLQDLDALPKGMAKLVSGRRVSYDDDAKPNTVSSNGVVNERTKERTISEPTGDEATMHDTNVGGMIKPKISVTDSGDNIHHNGSVTLLSSSQVIQRKKSKTLSEENVQDDINNPATWAKSDGALHHQALLKADGAAGSHGASGSRHNSKSHLAPLQRKDIFYSGSLLNIPLYRSQPDLYHKQVRAAGSRTSSFAHPSSESPETEKDTKKSSSMDLLKNPVFLMFGISNFLTSIGFNMPFIFLPDRAEIAGIDKNRAALLLSVIGIANTIGRMVFGYLSDQPWVNRLMLYNSALTVCGVATAVSPLVGGNYALLVVYAAVFGLFIGVYVSLTSVVLVDLLGLDLLTDSFGLLLLFQGVATFIGPPIAGWMYDWTGSYDISFMAMGTLIALSGAMLFFLPPIQRRYERKVTRAALQHDIDMGKHIASQGNISGGKDGEQAIGLVEVGA